MQRVTEFVKQRPGVLEGQQRRLACARLGEVHDVDDQRTDIATKLFLVAQRGHPGGAVLRRAREIIAEENPAVPSRLVAYLPHPHVGVPDRHVVAGLENEAEQAVRGIERGFDDLPQLEIRLDRRFVDVAAPLAQFLRVVPPVPWREGEVLSLRLQKGLQGVAIGQRTAKRRCPHLIEQRAHRLGRLRHTVVQPVLRKALVAEQPSAFGA